MKRPASVAEVERRFNGSTPLVIGSAATYLVDVMQEEPTDTLPARTE